MTITWNISVRMVRFVDNRLPRLKVTANEINYMVSVFNAIPQLTKMYLIDVCGVSIITKKPRKVYDLVELQGLEPDLFPKNVPG